MAPQTRYGSQGEWINGFLKDCQFDLEISEQIVKILPSDSPLYKWHEERIVYLKKILNHE